MKKAKRWLRVGFVLGYVLGTKAGRERYEDMRRAWLKVRTSEPFRTAETKVRQQFAEVRANARRESNGTYAPAEFAKLTGPGPLS